MAKANKKIQEEMTEMTEDHNIEETMAQEAGAVETSDMEMSGAEAAESLPETAANDETPAEPEEELAITQDDVRLVEAILFASSTSVSISMIAERFPEDRVKLIPDVLELLQEQYANRGVNLVQRENRWALRTSSDLGDQMRLEKEQPKKFTRAAQETMAIIAYHQPVTRAEIENIRGVATSAGALDALMEAGWIKPGKRREVPGRPVTWLTTQAFLDHFGLEKIEDLPGMEDLKAAGLLDKRPAIEAMPTADLFDGEGKAADEHDPQEVTDEDLIGKSHAEDDAGDIENAEAPVAEEADTGDLGGEGDDEDLSDDEDDLDDGDGADEDDEGDYENNEPDDEDFDDEDDSGDEEDSDEDEEDSDDDDEDDFDDEEDDEDEDFDDEDDEDEE